MADPTADYPRPVLVEMLTGWHPARQVGPPIATLIPVELIGGDDMLVSARRVKEPEEVQ